MCIHTIFINETTNVILLHIQSSVKLTYPNFPAWKVQFNALHICYDLLNFIDGTKLCIAQTYGDYEYWTSKGKLNLYLMSFSPLWIKILSLCLTVQKIPNKHGTYSTKLSLAKRECTSCNSRSDSQDTTRAQNISQNANMILRHY